MNLFSTDMIYEITSPQNLNISHREYSYYFTLLASVESCIKWQHSYFTLVEISYRNILIHVTTYPLF